MNARVGFRWADNWSLTVWARNLLDENYYELLTAAPGQLRPLRRAGGRPAHRGRDHAPRIQEPLNHRGSGSRSPYSLSAGIGTRRRVQAAGPLPKRRYDKSAERAHIRGIRHDQESDAGRRAGRGACSCRERVSRSRGQRPFPAWCATRRGLRSRARRCASSTKARRRATEAVSGDGGVYRVEGLAPGRYRVEAILDGFETAIAQVVLTDGQASTNDLTLNPARFSQSVVVTARRVEEVAQEVPIPVSVVRGDLVADAGAFNVNRLKEMLPTVQFYSTNPRNSAINIRGLGAPFGLTNDGIEPGVGLYIDGVFYARPASATLDFLDVEQVEVLRGPQGTLFGKNTTSGAINVTTRKPSFTPGSEVELNYGNFGYVQAKASVTGPLFKNVAGRISFSGTQRDGVLLNTRHRRRHERPQQPGRARADSGGALRPPGGDAGHRSHPPAPEGLHAGRGRCCPHAASRQPPVPGDGRRLRLHAAQLQRLRSPDGRRYAAALLPVARRDVAQRRLQAGAGARDLHDRLSLLGLEAVERPRLHRPARSPRSPRRRPIRRSGPRKCATPADHDA